MTKLTNPTNEVLAIQYKGVKYEIEASGSLSVPADVAEYWKTMIHEFILVSEDEVVSPVKAKEVEVKEEVEEVKEVEKEPVKVAKKK